MSSCPGQGQPGRPGSCQLSVVKLSSRPGQDRVTDIDYKDQVLSLFSKVPEIANIEKALECGKQLEFWDHVVNGGELCLASYKDFMCAESQWVYFDRFPSKADPKAGAPGAAGGSGSSASSASSATSTSGLHA